MKTRRIVKVDWIDPTNYRGWSTPEELIGADPIHCVACGILVKVKYGNIGVTHSVDANGKYGETMIIPRKAITKIEEISKFRH